MFELFASMRELGRRGLAPYIDHYEVVYVDRLPAYEKKSEMLEGLYVKFNVVGPEGFTGQSLSVSDIVAVKENGQISCHCEDSFGFRELPGFLKPENYLRNVEVGVEDVYSMIDGNAFRNRRMPTISFRIYPDCDIGESLRPPDLAESGNPQKNHR